MAALIQQGYSQVLVTPAIIHGSLGPIQFPEPYRQAEIQAIGLTCILLERNRELWRCIRVEDRGAR